MKRINVKLFLATLFLPAALFAQNTTFEDWDKDEDGLLEREEFTETFVDKFYNSWNADDQSGIIEEGFFRETYAGLDSDNDGYLSDEEWMVGYNYFYDDYLVYEDIDLIDYTEDDRIQFEEYYDALYDTNYFTDVDMDSDNYISQYELANYVFENWDFDNSGTISKSEFNSFDWYYLDV